MARDLELTVTTDLADDFDKHKHLLPGNEVSRRPDGDRALITWSVPGAPDRAAVMSPWFTLTGDRIELGGIDYYDAHGKQIT